MKSERKKHGKHVSEKRKKLITTYSWDVIYPLLHSSTPTMEDVRIHVVLPLDMSSQWLGELSPGAASAKLLLHFELYDF